MNRYLLLFSLFICFSAFGQKKKPPVTYKTIYDTEFSVGDRISLGEVNVVILPLGKDSLQIPDSLSAYRTFIQRNPNMTYKLHMNWKVQGVKYPGRTDRTRDALLTYLNEDGPDEDSTCYIDAFKHTFVKKQPEVLKVEIEIIGVKAPNLMNVPVQGVISLPEMNMLYRNYNNIVEFAVGGIQTPCWIEGKGVAISGADGWYIARVVGTSREVSMTLKTLSGSDTVSFGTYKFRVSNLPSPSIYLGTIELHNLGNTSESGFCAMYKLFAKYPPEIPLKAAFDVGEVVIRIGDKRIVSNGAILSEEYHKAFEEAEKGTEIVFESIEARGPDHFIIQGPFKRIKQSEKGTKIARQTDEPKCTG